MKKYILNKKYFILGIILLILTWQLLSSLFKFDSFVLPSFIDTLKYSIYLLSNNYIYKCLYLTLTRMFIGFIIAFVLAFIIGVIAGVNNSIEELLKPFFILFKSVPTATLIYLFLVLAGSRLTPLLIVVLVALPILYESVLGGIKNTPHELIDASKIDGSSNINTIIRIRIPLGTEFVKAGIASSFGLSLKIEIMAEVITGYTRLGLGSAILASQRSDPTNMVPVFAYSLIAIVCMLILDYLINLIIKK